MSLRTSRRRVLGLIGGFASAGLLAACAAPAAPTAAPTAAPAKPAEAPKPTTAPAATAPTEVAKPAAAAPSTGGAIKEALHWYTWSASDGEVWKQSMD